MFVSKIYKIHIFKSNKSYDFSIFEFIMTVFFVKSCNQISKFLKHNELKANNESCN